MTDTPKSTVYRVEPELVPAHDLMRGNAKFDEVVASGAHFQYGKSRSQILIVAYKRFLKRNPSATWNSLLYVSFTEQEEAHWKEWMSDLSMEAIASFKRWGFTPETAAFFRAAGICRTGHNIYKLIGQKNIDRDYFGLCLGLAEGDPSVGREMTRIASAANEIYDATYLSVVNAQELFAENGVELSQERAMDYIGYATVPRHKNGGKETMTVSRVPATLAVSLLRNNIPPEFLRAAWGCHFRTFEMYKTLIGAFMDGKVTLAQIEEYERLINSGRKPDDLDHFIMMTSSGIPFEYLSIIV